MDFAGSLAWIYKDAWGYDDAEALAFVQGPLAKHLWYPEFRLYIASIAGQPVGFIYGYRSEPGQWWHDTIRPEMEDAGLAGWLIDAYELAEVAVAHDFKGRRIGTTLISAFLTDDRHRSILLSAEMGSQAERAYRSHGFQPLLMDFRYPGFDDRITIMGRRHPAGDPEVDQR